MITCSVRSAIVGHFLSMCGMKTTEDISKPLKPYRIINDKKYVNDVTEGIAKTINLFDLGEDDKLYCIPTGGKVSEDVKDNLLGSL